MNYFHRFIIGLLIVFISFAHTAHADDYQADEENIQGSSGTGYTIDTENLASGSDSIVLQFGEILARHLLFDVANNRFELNDSLRVIGNQALIGELFIANDHDASDSDGVLNLGKRSGAFSSISWVNATNAIVFSDDIFLNLQEFLSARLENLGADPTCNVGSTGRIYFNTSVNEVRVCDGAVFIGFSGGGGGGGDFSNGGENGGADRSLGNTDNFDLSLLTNNTARVHIEGDGDVGIGTTSPIQKLHLEGGRLVAGDSITAARNNSGNGPRVFSFIDTNAVMRIWRFTAGAAHPSIEFVHGTNNDAANVANDWWDIYLHDTDEMRFRKRTGGPAIDILTIDADQEVGIRTTDPQHPLDINANGQALELGNNSANDIIINFDEDTQDRNFGWDESETSLSTFDNQLRFRTRQGSNPPVACSSQVTGMNWFDTDTGMLYVCDTSNGRNKWLTTSDQILAGEQTATCGPGESPLNEEACIAEFGGALGGDGNNQDLGFYLAHDMTITGYGFSMDNPDCNGGAGLDIEVWSSGSNAQEDVFSLDTEIVTLGDVEAANATGLNLDIDGNQYIVWGIDNNCGTNIDDFNILLYYRWRHD